MWRVRRSGRRGGRALKSDLYDYRHQGGGKNGYDDSNCREIRKEENWIVLELNPNRDILQSLAAKLYSLPEMHPAFLQARFDLYFC